MPQTKKPLTKSKTKDRKVGKSGSLLSSKPVIVFKTVLPAEGTLFPEKLKKINKMLSNVKWMN